MMFSNYFNKVLSELSQELRNTVTRNNNNTLGYDLSCAVKSWCRKLNLPDDAAVYIYKLSDNIQDLSDDLWRRWQQKTGFFNKEDSELKKYINYNVGNKMNQRISDQQFILLIAFAVTGIGYVLYLLNQQSVKEEVRDSNSQYPSTKPSHVPTKESWTLVLVINVGREDALQPLKTNGRVTTNDSEALYRATRALWMGLQTDFSQFRSKFKSDRAVPEVEQSEYDVYLVQIELDLPDSGFKPNANQIDRLDAFRRLPENSRQVIVSPRLPSKVYENTGFYSR